MKKIEVIEYCKQFGCTVSSEPFGDRIIYDGYELITFSGNTVYYPIDVEIDFTKHYLLFRKSNTNNVFRISTINSSTTLSRFGVKQLQDIQEIIIPALKQAIAERKLFEVYKEDFV